METRNRVTLKQNIAPYLFLFPAMAMFLYFVCWPALQSSYISFTHWEGIGPKRFIGFKNYIDMFINADDGLYLISLKNNLFWAVCSATVPVWIGLIQANLLVRGKIKYANVFQLIFFLPQIISTAVAAIIWRWIYEPYLGPIGTIYKLFGLEPKGWLGDPNTVMPALFVIYAWLIYGFCTVVFSAAIQGVDEQLYEASRIDGCSSWGQFRNVTLPGVRQSMNTVLLLVIIWSFGVFDIVMMITQGGPGFSSYVISYYVYYEGFIANHVGYATALSITLTIIILLFSMVFMRIRERGEK